MVIIFDENIVFAKSYSAQAKTGAVKNSPKPAPFFCTVFFPVLNILSPFPAWIFTIILLYVTLPSSIQAIYAKSTPYYTSRGASFHYFFTTMVLAIKS